MSVAVNGSAPVKQLEEGDPQRVVVGAIVEVAVHPPGLLGRDVGQRPLELLAGLLLRRRSAESPTRC